MNQKNLVDIIFGYSTKKLTDKEKWYSSIAQSYDRYRPRYPQILIEEVAKIVGLSTSSEILEIGCGPAIATVAFAEMGHNILCLEPNFDFCELARKNCQKYANVKIKNTSFEQWQETNKFDAVLAASSFHWVDQTIAYEKSSKVLKDEGFLILLWNKELQPSLEVYQVLSEIYQVHAPSLNRYEDKATQEDIIAKLGTMVVNSGRFGNLVSNYIECHVNCTVDNYLALLSTYSPYIELKSEIRENLFTELKDKINQNWGGSLDLSYISAYHIAQKA